MIFHARSPLLLLIGALFLAGRGASAQSEQFATKLWQGKRLFTLADQEAFSTRLTLKEKEDIYRSAARMLEAAAALDSTSQEAHYFLAYTYDRLLAMTGRTSRLKPDAGFYGPTAEIIVRRTVEATLASSLPISHHLERVLAISPIYSDEMLGLPPAEKLTAVWGTLAVAFGLRREMDSAVWAFREGVRRGGFTKLQLAPHRAMLAVCDSNAILLVSGDTEAFPLWYLQSVEQLRPDVTVLNLTLANTAWYTQRLKRGFPFETNPLPLEMADDSIALIDSADPLGNSLAVQWLEQPLTVAVVRADGETFKIAIPGYSDGYGRTYTYLRPQDRVVIDMLRANRGVRPVNALPRIDERDLKAVGLERYRVRGAKVDRIVLGKPRRRSGR